MFNKLAKISEWGVRPDTLPHLAYHIRLTNVLLLLMLIGSILETLLCFATGAIEAGLLNSTAPMVFGAGLYLMKTGRTKFARMFVIIVASCAGYAFVTALGPHSYFQFIYFFVSAFSFAIFSIEEKGYLLFAAVVPMICFILLEITHYEPIFGITPIQFGPTQLILARTFSLCMIWAIMLTHFFYFFRYRRRSEEQLVSSAKMVALGRMAAGIAHEVNNPLQIIVSAAEKMRILARSSGLTMEQVNSIADQIQSVSMRIADINKGLLSLSRDATQDPFIPVPVQSLLKLSLDFSKAHLESHKIELRVREFPKELTVYGRETQLSEVILNLINNASYAVQDSKVKIIEIKVMHSMEWVRIEVSDSGPGISPKILHRIFDPFFTTKPVGKGTGLGLSISQSIMAAHGGKLYYEPKGLGARFVIQVPRGPDVI